MEMLVLIDKLDDVMQKARAVPLTDQVRVDKEVVYDILDQLRAAIPESVKQAEYVKKHAPGGAAGREELQEAVTAAVRECIPEIAAAGAGGRAGRRRGSRGVAGGGDGGGEGVHPGDRRGGCGSRRGALGVRQPTARRSLLRHVPPHRRDGVLAARCREAAHRLEADSLVATVVR